MNFKDPYHVEKFFSNGTTSGFTRKAHIHSVRWVVMTITR
jgi:hypothetical protein